MLSIFEIPVDVRMHGDAYLLRVKVDGQYCYGEFCTMHGLILWVESNQKLLRDSLVPKKQKAWYQKDESISEIARRIEGLLNEDKVEERLAA